MKMRSKNEDDIRNEDKILRHDMIYEIHHMIFYMKYNKIFDI